jgi:hypothetical protein
MARLQLNLTETHDALIEQIRRQSRLKTKTDVVENALLFLGWAVGEAYHHGAKISAIDATGTRKEIASVALEGARMAGLLDRARSAQAAQPAAAAGGAFYPSHKDEVTSMPMAAFAAAPPQPGRKVKKA